MRHRHAHAAPLLCASLLLALPGVLRAQSESYSLAFSTYLGGTSWEQARDVVADAQGNLYVVGGTASADFPTTPGAYQRTFDATGTDIGSGGYCDVFVVKLDPSGALLWSTLLGGPNYDRAYAVELDPQGNVVVAGRAGPGFPTTAGVFQPTFQGTASGGAYGRQDAFVAMLSPDGSALLWASYAGVGPMARDMDIDASGDIYLPVGYLGTGPTPPAAWFANAFQATPQGAEDCGAMKVSGDGTQVLWATWLGGSGYDSLEASLRVDAGGAAHLLLQTRSTDIPTTVGAFDASYNGATDLYAARLSPDGSQLLLGTYVGGSANEFLNTHNLALDAAGNLYATPWTGSADFPTTPGAIQPASAGGASDAADVKISPGGALLASTFLGGSAADNSDGISIDAGGNVLVSGNVSSADIPVTPNAIQPVKGAGEDAWLGVLSGDLSRLLYATFLGGGADDAGRNSFLAADGSLVFAGQSSGAGWPAANAHQPAYAGGNLDVIVGRLAPDFWLLRNAQLSRLDPPDVPLASIFAGSGATRLDLAGVDGIPGPGEGDDDDAYILAFAPGATDPDASVCGDPARPLVFYEASLPLDTLRIVKGPTCRLRLDF